MTATSALDAGTAKRHALAVGFDTVGITAVRASDHAAYYRAWLDDGRHGDMAYLSPAPTPWNAGSTPQQHGRS